ncbi:prepilin peptidase [Microvirga aerilata]|uniref:Prepilin peptidase n=1 Tax=Microvirga aerilata TaxID=670292 RepID=A0A936ZKG2_9HYPH|nr:A24 family peptidase [Microvirga aerilata]MBL0406284.1 prepilin peptidase [Microvirga aerilata]
MTFDVTHVAALGVLVALALVVTVIDIRSLIIPDGINVAIFVTGLAASLLLDVVDLRSALAASALAAALLALVQVLFRASRGYDGLGWGDVKFVAAAATWTGLEGFAPALLAASVSALLCVLGMQAVAGSFDRHRRIPFGPFLALGTTAVAGFQLLASEPAAETLDTWLMSLVSGWA